MNTRNYGAGAIGGLVGGIVFGLILSYMGAMSGIAMLVGSSSPTVGWIVHLIISVIIGLIYTWWWGKMTSSYGRALGWGLLHGVIWWILGAMILLPLFLGLPVEWPKDFGTMNILSLVGHLVYGLVLGLVYYAITHSSNVSEKERKGHEPREHRRHRESPMGA